MLVAFVACGCRPRALWLAANATEESHTLVRVKEGICICIVYISGHRFYLNPVGPLPNCTAQRGAGWNYFIHDAGSTYE